MSRDDAIVVSFGFAALVAGLLAILPFAAFGWAGQEDQDPRPAVTASLDRQEAPFGSVVTLTLVYRLPEGTVVPEVQDVGGLEGATPVDYRFEPGVIRVRILVDRLERWESGELRMTYLDAQGQPHGLRADPVSLTVLSNLESGLEKAVPKPIRDILPTRGSRLLPLGLALVACVVVVAALVELRRRKRTRRTPEAVAVAQEPPFVRARREIEVLERSELFEKGEIKAFYFRFSEILRHYIESLRGFPAAEFTTEEIAACIEREEDRRVLAVLRRADLVKFADGVPSAAAKARDIQGSLSYIAETAQDSERGRPTEEPL